MPSPVCQKAVASGRNSIRSHQTALPCRVAKARGARQTFRTDLPNGTCVNVGGVLLAISLLLLIVKNLPNVGRSQVIKA